MEVYESCHVKTGLKIFVVSFGQYPYLTTENYTENYTENMGNPENPENL